MKSEISNQIIGQNDHSHIYLYREYYVPYSLILCHHRTIALIMYNIIGKKYYHGIILISSSLYKSVCKIRNCCDGLECVSCDLSGDCFPHSATLYRCVCAYHLYRPDTDIHASATYRSQSQCIVVLGYVEIGHTCLCFCVNHYELANIYQLHIIPRARGYNKVQNKKGKIVMVLS